MALQLYLNDYEQFFPLAWHVGGATLAEDLSNLTFYRSQIYDHTRADSRRLVRPGRDAAAAQRLKFAEIQKLWTDSTEDGWTRDYFAPDIIFPVPDPREVSYDRHSKYEQLVRDVSATQRPLLTDVNASLPNPEARDPNDPEHEAEMRKGFSTVQAAGIDVFVGVGPSLRRAGDCKSSRLDFRHRGGVNVLFLDGHVERVEADEKARLERIHRYWNSTNPTSDEETGK